MDPLDLLNKLASRFSFIRNVNLLFFLCLPLSSAILLYILYRSLTQIYLIPISVLLIIFTIWLYKKLKIELPEQTIDYVAKFLDSKLHAKERFISLVSTDKAETASILNSQLENIIAQKEINKFFKLKLFKPAVSSVLLSLFCIMLSVLLFTPSEQAQAIYLHSIEEGKKQAKELKEFIEQHPQISKKLKQKVEKLIKTLEEEGLYSDKTLEQLEDTLDKKINPTPTPTPTPAPTKVKENVKKKNEVGLGENQKKNQEKKEEQEKNKQDSQDQSKESEEKRDQGGEKGGEQEKQSDKGESGEKKENKQQQSENGQQGQKQESGSNKQGSENKQQNNQEQSGKEQNNQQQQKEGQDQKEQGHKEQQQQNGEQKKQEQQEQNGEKQEGQQQNGQQGQGQQQQGSEQKEGQQQKQEGKQQSGEQQNDKQGNQNKESQNKSGQEKDNDKELGKKLEDLKNKIQNKEENQKKGQESKVSEEKADVKNPKPPKSGNSKRPEDAPTAQDPGTEGEGEKISTEGAKKEKMNLPKTDEKIVIREVGAKDQEKEESVGPTESRTKITSQEFTKPKAELGNSNQPIPLEYEDIIK